MQNTELLLKELTLEEKCALLSGAETFKTRGMPQHAIGGFLLLLVLQLYP